MLSPHIGAQDADGDSGLPFDLDCAPRRDSATPPLRHGLPSDPQHARQIGRGTAGRFYRGVEADVPFGALIHAFRNHVRK